MNREIKFRAFDNVKNEMIYNVFFEGQWWAYYGEVGGTFPGYEKIKVGSTDGVDRIMQYTGLKDKNGKDIYEGDIMSHPDFSKSTLGPVEFDRGCFNLGGWDCIRTNLSYGEVIGNIYATPELLK